MKLTEVQKYEKIIDSLREIIEQKDSVILDKDRIIEGYQMFIRERLQNILKEKKNG